MRGCPYHTAYNPDCLYCRATPEFDASRVDWINRCPACTGHDIRYNEVHGHSWCAQCGANNKPSEPHP